MVIVTSLFFIETIRSILDIGIIKLQRKSNLSNNRKEKLSNSLSAVVYYTLSKLSYPVNKLYEFIFLKIFSIFLVLIFAANHFDDELFYSLSRKKNTFRLFEKSWFIIQMAYWLSTAIRNLQAGFSYFAVVEGIGHSSKNA